MDRPALERRLGLGDAVVVGLGAMVGAGVFAVLGPAADVAGGLLLAGLLVAAVVATCNALSSAQLAALHPESGGTYVYGRRELGPAWGFLAGAAFVVGKTASCAAMALTVGAYLAPGAARLTAVVAVLALTAVTLRGVDRTVRLTRVLLALVLLALAVVVVAGLAGGTADAQRLSEVPAGTGPGEVLQAAALLFFAFAGYARIATLGEEVRDPGRTIPRAVPLALAAALALYAVVAVVALAAVGPAQLAGSPAPLAEVVAAGSLDGLVPVVRAGAAVAALGVLLSLLVGVSRTLLAMGRTGDLPGWLAAVSPRTRVPHHAQLSLAGAVVVVVLVGEVRSAVGWSSFAVLVYYAVTHAAALALRPPHRRQPPGVAVVGLAGCLLLAASLPAGTVARGTALLVGCLAARAAADRLRRLRSRP